MTPEEFNARVKKVMDVLSASPDIDLAGEGLEADSEGTLPEIYVTVDGVDLCLTVSLL